MIEMKLRTETENFSIYFKTIEDLRAFDRFITTLIEKVKKKTYEEVMVGGRQ